MLAEAAAPRMSRVDIAILSNPQPHRATPHLFEELIGVVRDYEARPLVVMGCSCNETVEEVCELLAIVTSLKKNGSHSQRDLPSPSAAELVFRQPCFDLTTLTLPFPRAIPSQARTIPALRRIGTRPEEVYSTQRHTSLASQLKVCRYIPQLLFARSQRPE